MDQDPGYCLVLSTCPDEEAGRSLGTHLVENRLAACVNLVPGLTSIYRWQGALQQDCEVLLLIKTRVECLPDLTEALRRLHTYDLPEIIAVPIIAGLPEYLSWISQCTRSPDLA